MLRQLRIEGFKSLRDVTLDLGRFNVFIGANGAGKTNLLEAIGLLGAAASGRVDDESLRERGVRPGVPALYKSAFAQERKVRRLISLGIDSQVAHYGVALDNPIARPAKAWRIANESVSQGEVCLGSRGPGGARMVFSEGEQREPIALDQYASVAPLVKTAHPETPAASLIDALDRFSIFTPFTPMLRGTTPDTSSRADPMGLHGGRLADALLELSQDGRNRVAEETAALVDWVGDLGISTPVAAQLSRSVPSTRWVVRFRDRHMRAGRNVLSAFDASEGALYVVFLLVLALHQEAPPVLAIDNIDQALNPRLAKALVGRIQDIVLDDPERPQFLLTAHNPLALDGLKLSNPEVRLFTMGRTRRGLTQVRRITLDIATQMKNEKGGATLSQLWTQGLLGGVPDL